jgi:hypothetical protein
MRGWVIFVALLIGVSACGRYGPPVRTTGPAGASAQAEASADPNACTPEGKR